MVEIEGGDVLLRSDTLSLRLEGPSAATFAQLLAPLLRAGATLEALCEVVPGVPRDEMHTYLEGLVAAGAVRVAVPAETSENGAPLRRLLAQAGRDPAMAQGLADLRVGIVGLEAHGAHLAVQLAALGVGELALLDPAPLSASHQSLWPLHVQPEAPCDRWLAEVIAPLARATHVRVHGQGTLSREVVEALVRECDVVVSCVDRASAAANLWVNKASVARGIPAFFSQLSGHVATVGPLVIARETACYLCWRMRAIACEEDFEAAMAYEEWLDRQRRPRLHERAVLPGLPGIAAGLLTADLAKLATGLAPPSLAGRVVEVDGLQLRSTTHAVLQIPECPACGGPTSPPVGPTLGDLRRPSPHRGDVLGAADALVSPRVGLIRELERISKPSGEPERPYVYRARLANRRFHARTEARYWTCSGKGFTDQAARASALGEAAERYGGFAWAATGITYATRSELGAESLDPRALVLFAHEQYGSVPYARYTDATVLGWLPARSLVSGGEVFVPAIAVLMDYVGRSRDEQIAPITSNGLGGGATLLEAVLAATQEVLERDAFIVSWLNRLPAMRVDPLTHPDDRVVALSRAYRRRGIELELYALPTDQPCTVFLALGVARDDADLPAVVTGLGADLEPAVAARQAILEVGQVRPALRSQLTRRSTRERLGDLVADPSRVRELEDHDLLYASARHKDAFRFLRESTARPFAWEREPWSAGQKLELIVEWFARRGRDVLYCDLTPPELRRLHLGVARAIVPEWQPIYFGERERRLGGERLFELPRVLGFGGARRSVASLNPYPHPLA